MCDRTQHIFGLGSTYVAHVVQVGADIKHLIWFALVFELPYSVSFSKLVAQYLNSEMTLMIDMQFMAGLLTRGGVTAKFTNKASFFF